LDEAAGRLSGPGTIPRCTGSWASQRISHRAVAVARCVMAVPQSGRLEDVPICFTGAAVRTP